ncbi:hypothetical protein LG296_21210 (plasmid) [Ureibacillus chungkukjangi]|uniref:hypothetical protein n=1 Tax=Ureibacillus chungkukjangi TaxID=1202712 RepID=UPI000D366179|nr:hypothetical protein [Ureibacillus chungkukjangi]MCM3390208.1 hypothetical protein [Ureibacillus chungkukjangi]
MLPNPISAVFAFIFSALIMLYVPAYQTFEKQEDLAYLNTQNAVTNFVDNVRMKGFITPKMYEDFQAQLHGVGDVLYDVELVHKHKIYTPVYTNPEDITTFTDEYRVDYEEFYWPQIEPYLFSDASSTDYDKRIYKLEEGDFFEVYVKNKTKFKSTMLFNFLTGSVGDDEAVVISVPYGGMVLNEDY